MRVLFSVSVVLLCSMSLKAEYLYGTFTGSVFTFCDSELHLAPDTLSESNASLPAGTELLILGVTEEPCSEGGLASFWYEVSWQLDSLILTGYVPGTCLANTALILSDNTLFMYCVTGRHEESCVFTGTAKLLTQGEPAIETSIEPVTDFWNPCSEYSYSISSEISNCSGLTDVSDILFLNFTYEACGYENRVIPVFNTGTQLMEGPSASSVFEAGLFHSTTEILLPSGSDALENTMILRHVHEEWNENTASYDTLEITDRIFMWTGTEMNEV